VNTTYLRMEFIRLLRNRQNFLFSLIFPLVIFYAIAAPNKDAKPIVAGVSFPHYYFAGMLAFGALGAVISGGARISMERQVNWNRQLRLTPLKPRTYFRTKVLTSYFVAIIAILLLSAAAMSLGVHFELAQWGKTIGLALIALIPFAALGIMIGHLIKGDSMGPVMGFSLSAFAILGGAYFPIGGDSGFMHDLVRLIPSFWLVQAGKAGIGGQAWTAEAWIVVAVWAVLGGAGAAWAYRRDTKRV
jgi:ABC-2 type transport system permease protein